MKIKPFFTFFYGSVFGACLLYLLKLSSVFAQTYPSYNLPWMNNAPASIPPQVVQWTSSGENIQIQNSTNRPINVTITVDKNPDSPGVSISNCGNVRHLDAGSTVICTTSDSSNPITISSDSQTKSASGTYTIYTNCGG